MALGAALISSTSIFVVLAQVAPTVSAFYRMAFGGAMLLGWLVLTRRWRPVGWSQARRVVVPAIGFSLDLLCWHQSILWVGPGVATLLTNVQVFLMALVGALVYRERLGWAFLPGMLIAMAGLWLLVGAHWSIFDARHRLGVWLGLASAAAYTLYLLSFRRVLAGHAPGLPRAEGRSVPAAQWLAMMSLLSAALLGLCGLAEQASFALATARQWTVLLALGFFGQVLAWLLMVRAMPQLPASLVGLLLLLQPALAFVLDVLLFKRPTGAGDWLGLALALAGILLGSWRPRVRPVATPELRRA